MKICCRLLKIIEILMGIAAIRNSIPFLFFIFHWRNRLDSFVEECFGCWSAVWGKGLLEQPQVHMGLQSPLFVKIWNARHETRNFFCHHLYNMGLNSVTLAGHNILHLERTKFVTVVRILIKKSMPRNWQISGWQRLPSRRVSRRLFQQHCPPANSPSQTLQYTSKAQWCQQAGLFCSPDTVRKLTDPAC